MKTRNLVEASIALVEWCHAQGHYPQEAVEAALYTAADAALDRSGRMALIAAYALSLQSTVARDQFLAAASLPRRVADLLAADVVESPEPLPVAESSELTEADILALRQRALSDLANRAERVRLRVLTGGAGKSQTYREKLAEVERLEAVLVAEGDPDPADYPYLAAEVGVHGQDIEAVASLIRGKHSAWTPVNAAIEGIYFTAKAAIQADGSAVDGWSAIVGQAEADMLAELASLA